MYVGHVKRRSRVSRARHSVHNSFEAGANRGWNLRFVPGTHAWYPVTHSAYVLPADRNLIRMRREGTGGRNAFHQHFLGVRQGVLGSETLVSCGGVMKHVLAFAFAINAALKTTKVHVS